MKYNIFTTGQVVLSQKSNENINRSYHNFVSIYSQTVREGTFYETRSFIQVENVCYFD